MRDGASCGGDQANAEPATRESKQQHGTSGLPFERRKQTSRRHTVGLFTDPYQWYGRLSDEQLRAMRMVVDTGLHHKGWTRQQAIDDMLAHSSMAESDVIAEVERYIANPGQALGYKIGEGEELNTWRRVAGISSR